jgi:hypothetical protein
MRLSPGLLTLLALFGCASQNDYVKPEPTKPTYSTGSGQRPIGEPVVIERPLATLWRQLVSGTEKASLMVEGANQNSWTMQLHYSGEPKGYIDCGRVTSKVKTARGERNYDFAAAKSYQQYELQQGDRLYLVDRRMSLDVRATLVMESVSATTTRVKTESTYTITRDQSVQGGGGKPFAMTDKISFNGGKSAVFPNAATRCQATGELERDVLALLRRQ